MTATPPPHDDDDDENDIIHDEEAVLTNQQQSPTTSDDTACGFSWTAERLCHASYRDLGSPAAVQGQFRQHLLTHCRGALRALLEQSSTTTRDYSMCVDAYELLRAHPVLGHLLLRYPATLLPLLEAAVVTAQRACRSDLRETLGPRATQHLRVKGETHNVGNNDNDAAAAGGGGVSLLTRVHARLVHLPPPSSSSRQLSDTTLRASRVGRMVQVTGTVVRTGPVRMYESARTYRCRACTRTTVVAADVELRHNALRAPDICGRRRVTTGGDKNDTNNSPRCPGTKFKVVDGGSIHTDYQEVKIQESTTTGTQQQRTGHIPRSLLVKVQHDLVDACQPGDHVIVVGSLLAQWPENTTTTTAEAAEPAIDMAMMAHSVRVIDEDGGATATSRAATDNNDGNNSNNDTWEQYQRDFDAYWALERNRQSPIQARDFIVRAVCPKLYGMAVIKLALLVTLIGGVPAADARNQPQQREKQTDPARKDGDTDNDRLQTPAAKRPRVDHDNNNGDDDDDAPEQFTLPTMTTKSARSHHQAAWGTQSSHEDSPDPHQQQRRPAQNRGGGVTTRRRDQSHLLLVGDPGVGKSQVLKFAAALAPRSVLTTGVGTTSAGLTCAAVREGNAKEFSLEAGALVLADKGVCCIDEFGCIQDQDRTSIHEAMEQQTLSVAKAGIVCKLNCRATIIAVMNPRNCIYDNHASLSVNTGLGTPLLSRFDLIFKLVDAADAERDNNVTMYLLNRAIQGAGLDVTTPEHDGNDQADQQPWSMDKLRAYVAVVKERFQPDVSDAAARLLEAHYETCRASQGHTIPVTVRFLESLIRLSQAHARLMYRHEVTLQDAVAVVQLMECSAFAYGGFDGGGGDLFYRDPMSVDFSDEADVDLACFEYRLLSRYHMLAYMPPDRHEWAARRTLTDPSDGMYPPSQHNHHAGWDDVAHPRERR